MGEYRDFVEPLGQNGLFGVLKVHKIVNFTYMILRIVRMEFLPDKIDAFHQIFDLSKTSIRSFPGCHYLALQKDPQNPLVRYTYSHWESESALNAYRKSELFGSVWPKTKKLFSTKPIAFSLEKIEEVSLG